MTSTVGRVHDLAHTAKVLRFLRMQFDREFAWAARKQPKEHKEENEVIDVFSQKIACALLGVAA